MDLAPGVLEDARAAGAFDSGSQWTLAQLVLDLEQSAASPDTRGFLINFGGLRVPLALAEQLGGLLSRLSGERPVVCHAYGLSNATLWLAHQACDEIWLSPAGGVEAVGLAAQNLYLKELLDRFGVQAEFLHMGRYKSAAEALTRQGPSPAARESLGAVLTSVRAAWLSGLEAASGRAEIRALAEGGPWTPQEALERRLVTHLGSPAEAKEAALARAGAASSDGLAERQERFGAQRGMARALRAWAGLTPDALAPVVVIPLSGGITMSDGGGFGSSGITAARWLPVLRRLRTDDRVKAVVLRISSPGGSALASDLMWEELSRLRASKTVVASLADMAASGGYYLASAAEHIVSSRTTWLGSIGVVGGKIVFAEALERQRITPHTLAASPAPGAATRAAYLSPFTAWDEATRARVQAQLASVYDLFIRRVATGRGLAPGAVRQVAEGRIWSGSQGRERGLVDTLGGLSDAIALARRRADLPPDAAVRIELGPDPFLELLGLESPEGEDESSAGRALLSLARARWAPSSRSSQSSAPVRRWLSAPTQPAPMGFGASPPWLAPWATALLPFAEGLAPLLSGETVLAVAPLGLTLD